MPVPSAHGPYSGQTLPVSPMPVPFAHSEGMQAGSQAGSVQSMARLTPVLRLLIKGAASTGDCDIS